MNMPTLSADPADEQGAREPAPEPMRDSAHSRRAAIAAGFAPVLVLAAFAAVVGGLLDPGGAVAVFVVCTAWMVFEMQRYQRRVDNSLEDAAPPPQ